MIEAHIMECFGQNDGEDLDEYCAECDYRDECISECITEWNRWAQNKMGYFDEDTL